MDRGTAATVAVALGLATLMGCSGGDSGGGSVPLGSVDAGDLCGLLGPDVLAELTEAPFETGSAVPPEDGLDDRCFVASTETGLVVDVAVASERTTLAEDIVRYGSPAGAGETSEAAVGGRSALTAAEDVEGRQMADVLVDLDDRVLIVLVQQYTVTADGATPEDDLDLATAIAEHLLDEG